MHFDMSTLEGRHLVYAYASVVILQGAYALWMLRSWLKLDAATKKTTKPVS